MENIAVFRDVLPDAAPQPSTAPAKLLAPAFSVFKAPLQANQSESGVPTSKSILSPLTKMAAPSELTSILTDTSMGRSTGRRYRSGAAGGWRVPPPAPAWCLHTFHTRRQHRVDRVFALWETAGAAVA